MILKVIARAYVVAKNNRLAIFLALSVVLHAILVFLPHQVRHFKPKKAALAVQIVVPPPPAMPQVEWIVPESESPKPTESPKKAEKSKANNESPSKNSLIPKTWKEAIFEKIEAQKSAGLFYPKAAILQGLEGTAEVMIFLDAEGKVLAARLEATSGHAILDEAALKVARALKTLPRGAPTEIVLPIVFRLE